MASYKRSREDDVDNDYDRRAPRMKPTRSTYEIFDRLYFDIVEIGDPSRISLTNRLAGAGFGFANEVDSLAIRNGVLETIVATIMEQPHKTQLVSAIILVANSSNPLAGQLCVEHLHSKIEKWLKEGNYNHVKIAIRLLCCLDGIIEPGRGVSVFLHSLLDRAIERQSEGNEDARDPLVEELYSAVFLALPYLAHTLVCLGQSAAVCDELLEKANKHFQKGKSHELVEPYGGDGKPYNCELFIDNLHHGVNEVAKNQWKVKSFLDVPHVIELILENHSDASAKHIFPAVALPDSLVQSQSTEFIFPRVFFRSYMPIDVEGAEMATVPASESFDAVLYRDMLSDTIQHLDFNRKECAKQLFTLDLFMTPNTFTGPGISIDKLSGKFLDARQDGQDISTFKVEDVASEAILAELFRLATPPLQPAYFHSLFIEACIMAPQAIAPVFGRAVRFLFANLPSFDIELLHRFLDWFSHHLSNFGFTWKWQEWVEFVDLDPLDPRLVFIKQLIKKELRLSFASRIKETLPDELVVFVPEMGEVVPTYEYIEAENNLRQVADQLLDVFKDKFDLGVSDSYLEVLDAVKEAVAESENPREKLIDVVLGAAIFVGSRSLSLSQDWISRLSQQLQHMVESVEDESAAVTTVMNFYKNQPHVGSMVLHFLLLENVISPTPIISWLFESPGHIVFTENHGWESLIRTLDEVVNEGEVQDQVSPFKSVFRYLQVNDDESELLSWWKKQVTKSLIRKYVDSISHEQILEVVPQSVKDSVNGYLLIRPVVPVKPEVVSDKMDVDEKDGEQGTQEPSEAVTSQKSEQENMEKTEETEEKSGDTTEEDERKGERDEKEAPES